MRNNIKNVIVTDIENNKMINYSDYDCLIMVCGLTKKQISNVIYILKRILAKSYITTKEITEELERSESSDIYKH